MFRVLFYGIVAVIVAFVVAIRVAASIANRRHVRRLHDAKLTSEYMTTRVSIDQAFTEEWARLEPYGNWLKEWLAGQTDRVGKHSLPVTDDEIVQVIHDCETFSQSVKRALRYEHRMLKKLSADDKAAIFPDKHNSWSHMYYGARRIERGLKVSMVNQYRRTRN